MNRLPRPRPGDIVTVKNRYGAEARLPCGHSIPQVPEGVPYRVIKEPQVPPTCAACKTALDWRYFIPVQNADGLYAALPITMVEPV